MRGCAIAEADIQAGTVPTVAVGVDKVEDNVASVLDDAGTFSDKATIGIQSEAQRQLLGQGAVGVNSEVEHASSNTSRVDGTGLEGVVHEADIGAC